MLTRPPVLMPAVKTENLRIWQLWLQDVRYIDRMLSYLDAATGSMVLMALAGGAAGIAVFARMYWHRFLGLFSKKHKLAAQQAREQLTGSGKES